MQFSSGLNYLIDIENTVIAMWRLRLRTYDEVAATKPWSSGLTWRHFRVGHNRTHCAAARLPRRQHARRFAVASPGAAAANLSLDHLVGEREQLVGRVEAERLSGLEVDSNVELGRLHDWKIGGLLTLENPAGIDARQTFTSRVPPQTGGIFMIPTDLNDYSLLTIFLVSIVFLVAASEAGRLLGVRAAGRGGDDVSTLEAAILGLLALMIGFTFAMALTRFDARRDAVVNEANAIGTTALRARLLPAPHNVETNKLLQEYVWIRLDITQRVVSTTELNAAIARLNEIQEALWQQAKIVASQDKGVVPTGLFIQTLNEMIDNQGKRLDAFRNRVPNIVLLALYGVAIVARPVMPTGSRRGACGYRSTLWHC